MEKLLHKILDIFFLEFWWKNIRYPKYPRIIRLAETKTQLLKYLESKGIGTNSDFILKFSKHTIMFTWRQTPRGKINTKTLWQNR